MKAAVYHGPHDIRLVTAAEPGHPGPGEVLIEVLRAGLCGSDTAEFSYGPVVTPINRTHPGSGHHGPVTLGHEFVGRVLEIGTDVTDLQIGQRVVPGAGVFCGRCSWCLVGRTNLCATYYTIGMQANGGLADLVLAPARICVPVPDGCSDDAAALAQPLAVALHALDRSRLEDSDIVVISGVGGIGAFLVAGAAARGCHRIVAIDVKPAQLTTARALGATHVINALETDVVTAIRDITDGAGADVVVEASGAPGALATAIESTKRGGRTVLVGLSKNPPIVDTSAVTLRELELVGTVAHICDQNIPEALGILSANPSLISVVDRVIAFDTIVSDGFEPLERREVLGKVLIRIDSDSSSQIHTA